jgi:hypothetical protein
VLQLWGNQSLHQGLLYGQVGQLSKGHGTCGELAVGPTEGNNTVDWPYQLHHCGGDPIGEEVLTGMFFLDDHPIIILFDSVASQEFMSSIFCQEGKVINGSYSGTICD